MASSSPAAVMWFRRDLRLHDNPAWAQATAAGTVVHPVFVLDPRLVRTAGAARQALLFSHLQSLDAALTERGGRLRVLHGDASLIIPALMRELHAASLHWNEDTTPFAVRRDAQVRRALAHQDPGSPPITVATCWGTLVHPPGSVLTQKGTLSQVFTPFYKRWITTPWDEWPDSSKWSESQPSSDVAIAAIEGDGVPRADAAPPIEGGEEAAFQRLDVFDGVVDDYLDSRDTPSMAGTSYLSSDLRFGTLSPRFVATRLGEATPGRAGFVRQLAWRDWYAHLLAQNPHMPDRCIRPDYDNIAWVNDDDDFTAWCAGQTGYPLIDAGLRELLATGWMHNRVRMVVGSFLVKHLLIDWRRGERFFRHHLIDADVAQNVGNWQWVAGTGPDAAPYFRVFNPLTQSRKFDGAGAYIRSWVPELRALSDRAIHAPWEAAPLDLAAAGVTLGDTYPHPIVDHAFARERVLATYKTALGR